MAGHGTLPAVQFGAWIPLAALLPAEAGSASPPLPTIPGVFQLRVEQGLLAYPRGRSAMVAYGAGSDLQAALAALLRGPIGEHARRLGPLLCRFAAADPHRLPAEHLARLHERFVAQFGSLPLAEAAAGLPAELSAAALAGPAADSLSPDGSQQPVDPAAGPVTER